MNSKRQLAFKMTEHFFKYGTKEIEHLKGKDQRLAEVIDKIGMIKRPVIPDLFQALMHAIIGQQISTKAHTTIWERMKTAFPVITPESVSKASDRELQQIGISFRKIEYMQDIARQIEKKEFDLQALYAMDDKTICTELSQLRGIGVWTAEMLMIFSMQRSNVLSYGDLAILRGLRMLYHHRAIRKKNFVKYWRRYTPYASVASLYLWAVAGGAIPDMKDYATKKM